MEMVYKKCCLLTGRLAARQMSPAICKTFIKADRETKKKQAGQISAKGK